MSYPLHWLSPSLLSMTSPDVIWLITRNDNAVEDPFKFCRQWFQIFEPNQPRLVGEMVFNPTQPYLLWPPLIISDDHSFCNTNLDRVTCPGLDWRSPHSLFIYLLNCSETPRALKNFKKIYNMMCTFGKKSYMCYGAHISLIRRHIRHFFIPVFLWCRPVIRYLLGIFLQSRPLLTN